MKPMINMGSRQNQDKTVELLRERGYDIYVLRLRTITEYPVTIHGFDRVTVENYRSPNSTDVQYRVTPRPSSYATFDPNEEGVATAYVPGTRRNIDIIAAHLYSNQFTLVEIITPSGSIPQGQAIARIRERADKMGVKPLRRDDAFTKHLETLKRDRREIASESEIKIMPKAPAQQLIPLTSEQALAQATESVQLKYTALIEYLKVKSPKGWTASGEYRNVVLPEIKKVAASLGYKETIEEPEEALVK